MTINRSSYAVLGAVLSVILGGYLYWSESAAWAHGLTKRGDDIDIGRRADGNARNARKAVRNARGTNAGAANGFGGVAAGFEYDPVIRPRDFVRRIDNKYFTLTPGMTLTYEKMTPDGVERNVVEVTSRKRKILGVTTTEVWDRVWLNGQLKEDARDWYAQDRRGNVWYFGEAVNHYERGRLKDHKGSWEAGVNGAKAGIMMLADPIVGVTYRQEFARGVAEDMGSVIALDQTVTGPTGTFHGCLQTRDWSNIDKTVGDKYYCPEVGFVALEESVPPGNGRLELISGSDGRSIAGLSNGRGAASAFSARGNASVGRNVPGRSNRY
jgi:hypothetical protein